MQSIKRKGMSSIVVIVFLILISMAIVSMLYVSINKLGAQLSPQISCTERQINPHIEIAGVCYNPQNKNVELTLRRDISRESIDVLNFFISNDLDSSSWICSNSCGNCVILGSGEIKKYYFDFENFRENSRIGFAILDCLIESREILLC
ncbi:MAG: hypothetical protein AABX73_00565 [Nanoarchaeota archaeon]